MTPSPSRKGNSEVSNLEGEAGQRGLVGCGWMLGTLLLCCFMGGGGKSGLKLGEGSSKGGCTALGFNPLCQSAMLLKPWADLAMASAPRDAIFVPLANLRGSAPCC